MADKKGSGDGPSAGTGNETSPKGNGAKPSDATAKQPVADKGAAKPKAGAAGKSDKSATKSGAAKASKPRASAAKTTPAKSGTVTSADQSSTSERGTSPTPAGAASKDEISATDTGKAKEAGKAVETGKAVDAPKDADSNAPSASKSETSTAGATTSATSVPKTATKSETGSSPASAPAKPQSASGQSAARSSETPRQTALQAPKRGGFFPLFLGGICAGAIGFGAAYYILPEMGIMTRTGDAEVDVAARLDEQSQRLDALAGQIADLPGTPDAPDLSGIEGSQQALDMKMSELSQQVAQLFQRIDKIESEPSGGGAGVSPAQLSALRDTLARQGEQLDQLNRAAEERDNEARTAAQQALRRAALSRIATALDTGSEFTAALGDLERAGMSAPDALQEVADTGVPTRAGLQEGYAPAARAALTAARQSGVDGEDPDLWSFMSDQLGARSLERKEGPTTDAILSRVEDELRQGNLEAALTEFESLPEPAKAELADWAAQVRARMQAVSAHDALAAKLN
ncbi:Uncharacterized conserved protein [Roseovarius nanhaiticus]|uniref:Uncharacterized conserved protein n=1 Tax=Roseovarius nanhaiticus TaxID=573024 RepID=A0A1N7F7U5_9RHOB|nr:hypothetical protein [Roseovarius nanhaiticus]SEK59993.1 Uncharacterized conserved protein [Roseovarius nanhaiticus]SIR96356.1 Uncharacterized conserved protein [Roseovarius nanhaiticus]